uniref:Uncharacterized protein n=1 Tax=Solanum tuberosum TaxID=4113 RepID=M1AHY1_SOLTU
MEISTTAMEIGTTTMEFGTAAVESGTTVRIGTDEKKDESKPQMSLPELTSAACIRVRKFIIVDRLIFDRIEFELYSHAVWKFMVCGEHNAQLPPPHALAMIQTKDSTAFPDPCRNFAFPPPPPGDRRQIGPRLCPVCYVPVEQAIARMPRVPSVSPRLQHLTYFHEQIPMKTEPHRGSAFGGYPSLVERNASFDIKEPMTLHLSC